jgi:hypothetical protein
MVNSHILHNKSSKKKISLEMFYEKVAEGLLTSAGMENGTQGDNNSTAGRLVGRDHFLYRTPATHARMEETSHVASVRRKVNARPERL